MVKSKARSHFCQFIRNKPTKWGVKFWVLADSTGFTSNCSLYCGKQHGRPICDNGLAFDVVTDILHAYDYQGYSVYFDNCYTLPTLLHASKERSLVLQEHFVQTDEESQVLYLKLMLHSVVQMYLEGLGTTSVTTMMCTSTGGTIPVWHHVK